MTYYEVKKVSGSDIWFKHLALYGTVSPMVRLHASSFPLLLEIPLRNFYF